MKLVVSSAAFADVERLREFLADKTAVAASAAVTAIDDGVQSLLSFPQRGRPAGIPTIRELIIPFGQSAYVLRYSYSAAREEIVILRIWHSREERS